jgi:hypothetical protein
MNLTNTINSEFLMHSCYEVCVCVCARALRTQTHTPTPFYPCFKDVSTPHGFCSFTRQTDVTQ